MIKSIKFFVTLLTIILLIGSMSVTVYANTDDLEVVNTYIENLDDEYYAVIEDLSSKPDLTRATTHKVKKVRNYWIKRKSDNALMVKFTLTGTFTYNGKTSSCTYVDLDVYNKDPSRFTILKRTYGRTGMWATANCAARNRAGKVFSKNMKIGVKPDGSTVMP